MTFRRRLGIGLTTLAVFGAGALGGIIADRKFREEPRQSPPEIIRISETPTPDIIFEGPTLRATLTLRDRSLMDRYGRKNITDLFHLRIWDISDNLTTPELKNAYEGLYLLYLKTKSDVFYKFHDLLPILPQYPNPYSPQPDSIPYQEPTPEPDSTNTSGKLFVSK